MIGRQTSRWWTVALAAASLALIAAAAKGRWTWVMEDMFRFEPRFADTVAVLAAGEAHQAGADIYADPMPYDPLGRPHVYGPGWLITGRLGLTRGDAVWLGTLLALAFVAAAAAVLRVETPVDALLGSLLITSPPVMLAISRGNNDLVIFMLLALAAAMLAQPCLLPLGLGAGSLALAATLKFYPFSVLPAVLLAASRRRWSVAAFVATIFACLAVLWVWRYDFLQAIRHTPDPRTASAYGIPVMVMMWESLGHTHLLIPGGWIAGTAVVMATLWPCRRTVWNFPSTDRIAMLAYVLGAGCWIFCFLTVRNYPYRFVLLLLAARAWLSGSGGRAGRLQVIWWIIVAWFDPVKLTWAARAAHDPTGTSADWSVFTFAVGFEQGAALALTAVLLVVLLRIALRSVRSNANVAAAGGS